MPVLFITVVIDLIGFGIILPIMPFLAPQLGGDDFDVAMIIATYSVFAGICGPFWGKLSDRIGRKPVILICLAGGSLAYLMLAFSSSLLMIYISRAVGGLMAGNFGVASAMIADITTPENRARGMGLIGAAFGIGLVIGPFMGGILAGDEMNFMRPALAAAGLSMLAMIAGGILLKESHTREQRALHAADHGHKPKLSLLSMIKTTGNFLLVCQYLIHNSCVSLFAFLFPLMARDVLAWGPKEVGIVFGIQGIYMAILQGSVIGPATKRLGELRCLFIGVANVVIGMLCFALLADSMVLMVASLFITVTGTTFCGPMLNSLISKRTPDHLRGRMLGTTASVSAWGRVVAPVVGGAILSLTNFSLAWLFGVFSAALFLAWVVSELKKAPERVSV